MRMKKTGVFLLVATLALTGCGAGSSGKKEVISNVTIQDFKDQVVSEMDKAGSVDVKEEGNGKTFSVKSVSSDSIYNEEWEVTGVANSDDMISSVKFVIAADGDYYNDLTMEEIKRLIKEDDMGSLTWSEFQVLSSLDFFARAVALFSEDSSSDAYENGMAFLLDVGESGKSVNGWEYSVNAKSEEITYSATYVGE